MNQSCVGRDRISFLDKDDVAWHEFRCGDALSNAFPDHVGARRRHLPQRSYGLLGSRFLEIAQRSIEKDDDNNRDCFVGQC